MPSRLGNCLSCQWLGDKIMGQDVDLVLGYATPKIVKIRDRSLGIMKLLLMLLIFIYIVIFNIWFKGQHFKMEKINGIARMQFQAPTQKCNPMELDCMNNFKSTAELPYCSQYKGAKPEEVQRPCRYYDAKEIPIYTAGGVIMPSHVKEYDQVNNCRNPDKDDCPKLYEFLDAEGNIQTGTGGAKSTHRHFIAGYEDFTILLDHSFRIESGAYQYDDFSMNGHFVDCHRAKEMGKKDWEITPADCDKREIKCLHNTPHSACAKKQGSLLQSKTSKRRTFSSLAFWRGSSAEVGGAALQAAQAAELVAGSDEEDEGEFEQAQRREEEKGYHVFSIKIGDFMSLGTLLHLAGKDLDDVARNSKGKSETVREDGTAVHIEIVYNNMRPWTLIYPMDPPEYTIKVTPRPVRKYKHFVSEKEPEGRRKLYEKYGTFIVVQQTGHLGVFSYMNMVIVLTAALGLLAVANTLTDLLAFSVLPNHEEYAKYKTELSKDFGPRDQKELES